MSLPSCAQTLLGLRGLHLFILCTLTVCLAWQPAGLDNNNASVEVSKQLMVRGTEGTPTVAACHLPGQWSEQARTKANLFASKLENQCVSCVLVSLPFSWLKGRMLVQQPADSFQASTHSGDLPAYHITPGNSEKAGPSLSVWTASKIIDRAILSKLTIQTWALTMSIFWVVYFLDSYSNKLCANFFFIIDRGLEGSLFPAWLGKAGIALWAAYVMVYEEGFSSYSWIYLMSFSWECSRHGCVSGVLGLERRDHTEQPCPRRETVNLLKTPLSLLTNQSKGCSAQLIILEAGSLVTFF